MRAVCRHSSIAAAVPKEDLAAYKASAIPTDYDFGLEKGREYFLLGIAFRRASVWLYVSNVSPELLPDVILAPAPLFDLASFELPTGMSFRSSPTGTDAELMPLRLSNIDRWYERFVDDDEEVVRAVEQEIRARL